MTEYDANGEPIPVLKNPFSTRPAVIYPSGVDLHESMCCWCTGLRHEHDKHGCPPHRVPEGGAV